MRVLLDRVLRGACLLAFGAALLQLAGVLPPGTFERAPWVAGLLLLAHLLELPFALPHLRADRTRPLARGVCLTLLFGVLHWKPLADAARRPPQT